jgi:hypothetical protein
MKRDDEPGRIRRTSIARQALVPGKPPMRTLRSGPDLLGGRLYAWWRERSGAFQVDSLAADHGCRQVRRMLQCGQSRRSTGAETGDELAGLGGGEESE